MIKDFVNGEKFKALCDFDFRNPKFEPGKSDYIIYSDLDRYVDALSFASQHMDKNFVLVTHNGDRLVDYTCVPGNIKAWYTQNLNFEHERIFAIPIGLENPQWHPNKIPTMMQMPKSEDRVNKGFCQYNPDTYPQERKNLVQRLQNSGIDVEWFPSINGQYFTRYLFNLKVYKYCFCPRGNGVDTHRIWEAIYMGCIPVVKKHISHDFIDCDLPILFVDEWEDFNYQETYGNFNSKLLTMEYWKDKICQSL